MLAGKCFAMSGSYAHRFDSRYKVELKSGEWSELPEGSYELTVGDDSDVHMIRVWEIPEF